MKGRKQMRPKTDKEREKDRGIDPFDLKLAALMATFVLTMVAVVTLECWR